MNVEQIEQQNQRGRFASLKNLGKAASLFKALLQADGGGAHFHAVRRRLRHCLSPAFRLCGGHLCHAPHLPGDHRLCLLYLSVVLLQMVGTIVFARLALRVEMYLGRDLKKKLFVHLQTLSFSYYNTTPVGTIMARVMSDTNRIGSVFAWSLVDIFWSAAYVIGSMAVMLSVNWQLALLVIGVVPVIALLTLYFQKRILRINRQAPAHQRRDHPPLQRGHLRGQNLQDPGD